MAGKMGEKKARRIFTPERKIKISKDIEGCRTIKTDYEASARGFLVSQVEAAVGNRSTR